MAEEEEELRQRRKNRIFDIIWIWTNLYHVLSFFLFSAPCLPVSFVLIISLALNTGTTLLPASCDRCWDLLLQPWSRFSDISLPQNHTTKHYISSLWINLFNYVHLFLAPFRRRRILHYHQRQVQNQSSAMGNFVPILSHKLTHTMHAENNPLKWHLKQLSSPSNPLGRPQVDFSGILLFCLGLLCSMINHQILSRHYKLFSHLNSVFQWAFVVAVVLYSFAETIASITDHFLICTYTHFDTHESQEDRGLALIKSRSEWNLLNERLNWTLWKDHTRKQIDRSWLEKCHMIDDDPRSLNTTFDLTVNRSSKWQNFVPKLSVLQKFFVPEILFYIIVIYKRGGL